MMNESIGRINLLLLATGLSLMFISLHYRDEKKCIEYSLLIGYAKNLNIKGKVIFFTGLVLEIISLIV